MTKTRNRLTSANVIAHEPKADMDYRAQGDCSTLRCAQEIMADKSRHAAAKKHAAKEAKHLAKVAGQ